MTLVNGRHYFGLNTPPPLASSSPPFLGAWLRLRVPLIWVSFVEKWGEIATQRYCKLFPKAELLLITSFGRIYWCVITFRDLKIKLRVQWGTVPKYKYSCMQWRISSICCHLPVDLWCKIFCWNKTLSHVSRRWSHTLYVVDISHRQFSCQLTPISSEVAWFEHIKKFYEKTGFLLSL